MFFVVVVVATISGSNLTKLNTLISKEKLMGHKNALL